MHNRQQCMWDAQGTLVCIPARQSHPSTATIERYENKRRTTTEWYNFNITVFNEQNEVYLQRIFNHVSPRSMMTIININPTKKDEIDAPMRLVVSDITPYTTHSMSAPLELVMYKITGSTRGSPIPLKFSSDVGLENLHNRTVEVPFTMGPDGVEVVFDLTRMAGGSR